MRGRDGGCGLYKEEITRTMSLVTNAGSLLMPLWYSKAVSTSEWTWLMEQKQKKGEGQQSPVPSPIASDDRLRWRNNAY